MGHFRISPTTGNKLPVKKDQTTLQKSLHVSADYFEPLFRAKLYRAFKQVQSQTSINALAMAMGNLRQAKDTIPRNALEDAITSAVKRVLIDSFTRGGKLGAVHVKESL